MDEANSIVTILLMAFLILLSGFFSAVETAFSSVNKTKLKTMENQGNKRAKRTLALLEDFDNVLSSVLIGNNIVNIGLASIATIFFIGLVGNLGSTLSTVVITILVLIFGEITPKSLAKEYAESFAISVTPFIAFLCKLLKPLNFLFSKWKKFMSRRFKSKPKETITDDELLTIINEATNLGGIDIKEGDLIRNAIEFSDLRVSDILIPRTQIKAVHKDDSIEDITAMFLETEFSRLPVYDQSLDDIIGILYYKDFMSHVRIEKKPLMENIQPVLFVAPSKKIHDLLISLQKQKRHIVVVTDEYGGTMGIVTMEDILEELVGEIFDETDDTSEYVKKIDENTYLLDTFIELDDFFKLIHAKEDEDTDANTLSGWINERLNAIPKVGDKIELDNALILVIQADKNRAIRVKLSLFAQEQQKHLNNKKSKA